MLQIKGKLNTVAMEVPISVESLNSGDSFLLDAGYELFLWHGRNAGIMEKNKARPAPGCCRGDGVAQAAPTPLTPAQSSGGTCAISLA